MPQSQLPDLNTMWLKWTDHANTCLLHEDYMDAISAVYHINAIFSDENRIEFNTEKFNKLTKEQMKIVCPSCRKEIYRSNVEFYEILNTVFDELIFREKRSRVWDCPECNQTVRIDRTEFIQEKFSNPRYIGIIPDPPKREMGLMGRRNFERQTRDWVRLALDEISFNLGIERREYIPIADRVDVTEDATDD